jgi:small subunit ribosomal protein S15
VALHKERKRANEANWPHVVLGTRPNEEHKWQNCDLAKVLVSQEGFLSENLTTPESSENELRLPIYCNFGVGEAEKRLLFENLPYLSAQEGLLTQQSDLAPADWVSAKYLDAEKRELDKANTFARAIDLRNANTKGIAYENRRRIIAEFSEPSQPWNPGRPEVQGVLEICCIPLVLSVTEMPQLRF